MLGDFGADVIKVEHPAAATPPAATGRARTASGCGGRSLGRNKRTVTLNLSAPEGQELFLRRLVATRRRAGRELPARHPRALGPRPRRRCTRSTRGWSSPRVTGFGQFGPYAGAARLRHAGRGDERVRAHDRPAGRPADAAAVRPGRRHRRRWPTRTPSWSRCCTASATGARPGRSTWPSSSRSCRCSARSSTVYDQLGVVQQRTGNRSANNAPRNTYRTARRQLGRGLDQRRSRIAERVMRAGRPPRVVDEPWFAHRPASGPQHADELDDAVGAWIAARTTRRGGRRVRGGRRRRSRPIYDVAGRRRRPAVPGARHRRRRSTTRTSAR